MSTLLSNILQNALFVLEFLGIVLAVFLVAYGVEKLIQKKNHVSEKILTTRKVTMIGMFSAVSGVMMLFEIGIPFIPYFYKLDFSEIPVLICGFAFGPVAGVLTEFVKILVKLVLKGTSTAFVGELANFVVGCALILPATIIYQAKRKKVFALLGCLVGTVCITIVGSLFNAVYLLPVFAVLFHTPLEELIAVGTALNPAITDVTTFVCLAVAPMNLIKGFFATFFTLMVYIPVSIVFRSAYTDRPNRPNRTVTEP